MYRICRTVHVVLVNIIAVTECALHPMLRESREQCHELFCQKRLQDGLLD